MHLLHFLNLHGLILLLLMSILTQVLINCVRLNVIISNNVSAINSLKSFIMSNSDYVPSFRIKDRRYVFLEPLSIIFNGSFQSHCALSFGKKSKVCPVFKSGKKT